MLPTWGNRMKKIYLIEHPDDFHKIGYSNSPTDRLSAIQASCPYTLKILTAVKSSNAPVVEKTIHKTLSDFHVRGEWFNLPDCVVDAFLGRDELHTKESVSEFSWAEKRQTLDPDTYNWYYDS